MMRRGTPPPSAGVRLSLALLCALAPLPAATAPAHAGRILSEDIVVTERDIRDGKPHENLLDSMDLAALSPAARFLAMPRPMVTPELAGAIRTGSRRVPDAEWRRIIAKAAAVHSLPEALIEAMIRTESDFNASAVSPKGAQGAMQIMPSAQQDLGLADPFDPESNVLAGCTYLRRQLRAFGSLELALAAYNAGPGSVRRYGGVPPYAETRRYVARILASLPEGTEVR